MRQMLVCFLLFCAAFSAKAQYVINGNASHLGGNEYQLTPENFGQGGSVWYQVRLDLRYDFVINGELNLGRLDGGGADGIAFVLQPLSSDLGGSGGGIGYYGISPSLAVEFDTWQNTDRGDPAQDHLGFMHNGSVNHGGVNFPTYLLPNIEDATYHNAEFRWNATTHTLTVNYLGFTFVHTEDIINTIFSGNPYVYWGFTAATGAAINDQRVRIGATTFVEEMHISGVVTNTSCGNPSNGAVDITVTGGVPPYSFSWSNGAASEDLSGVGTGNYTVTVTDAAGVSMSSTFTVGNTPDEIAPDITCPVSPVSRCFSPTGSYTIPQPVASDVCGITSSSFVITGATSRSGTGLDASGAFNPGTSTVTWTVEDASGNISSCSTDVVVNSALSATIPNVFAVSPGGQANTIYIGYGPSSLTITATPSGGTGPYTYLWSTGATTSSITVSPAIPGSYVYSVTVTDAAGCTTVTSTTIKVVDVRCGNKNDKVVVCHVPPGNSGNAHDICISRNAVETHLMNHGDMLGSCVTEVNERARTKNLLPEESGDLTIQPNPSRGQFELRLNGRGGKAEITVFNANGIQVQKRSVQLNGKMPVAIDLRKEAAGVYLVQVNVNGEIQTSRVVIQR